MALPVPPGDLALLQALGLAPEAAESVLGSLDEAYIGGAMAMAVGMAEALWRGSAAYLEGVLWA